MTRQNSQTSQTGGLSRIPSKKLTRLMSSDGFKNLQIPDSEEERAAKYAKQLLNQDDLDLNDRFVGTLSPSNVATAAVSAK